MVGGGLIRTKAAILVGLAGGAVAYYYLVYLPKHPRVLETAYVLPKSLVVVDTPAEIRLTVATLKSGDRVEVVGRAREWVRVTLPDGRAGWVEAKDVLDSASYQEGQELLREVTGLSAQAVGHTEGAVNLRLEPSRAAVQLAQLPQNQKIELFGRRQVERSAQAEGTGSTPAREAWYLVRADSRAGWVLGRFVALDIPTALSAYAQSTNLVAWVVLNTVRDGGQQIPQYVVADRQGARDVDFNHIRVFTWWAKNQHYVTAYVEGGLSGYFPIRVSQAGGVPCFRLRLIDKEGRKVQKVYSLSDTMTRVAGIVDGWESDAMPAPTRTPRRRRR